MKCLVEQSQTYCKAFIKIKIQAKITSKVLPLQSILSMKIINLLMIQQIGWRISWMFLCLVLTSKQSTLK